MGRKESGSREGQAYWETYAKSVEADREATSSDADAAPCSCQRETKVVTDIRKSDLYVTMDEYIDMLSFAVEGTYYPNDSAVRSHPEDVAINVEVANEILWRAMSRLLRRRHQTRSMVAP